MASTTGTLSDTMSTFYDKVFLDRAKAMLVHDYGAQKKSLRQNEGKSIKFNRFTPLALATTALTEGTSNPSQVNMSTTVVSTTVATYGNWTTVADLFSLTSIDTDLKEHVEVHGQNAGETLDSLIAKELSTGATAQYAGGKVLTTVATTDTLTGAEIRKAVRTLKENKAMKFENGMYRGIIQPFTAYDLFGNTEWLNTVIYTDPANMKAGIIGKLHGVEFKETNQGSWGDNAGLSGTTDVYHNFIFGKNAYGIVELEGQAGPRIYVKTPGSNSTDNPLDIYSTVGWKAYFACKTLNANWIINVVSGATA